MRVPANLLVQPPGGYSVKLCEVGIKQYALTTHQEDCCGNLDWRLD